MKLPACHSWDLSPKKAIALQRTLASRVVHEDDLGPVRTLAAADLALDNRRKIGWAGVIVFEFPSLKEIERVYAEGPLQFPYVPGLLSFREGPILLKAFSRLPSKPDLVIFDGQGLAHPRRFGIACHIGLLLECPSIGCAKSLLCGEYQEPGTKRGSWSPLIDRGETVGAALRTRDGVKPVFVSPGHRIGLESSIRILLQCHSGFRVPKPTREADIFVEELSRNNS